MGVCLQLLHVGGIGSEAFILQTADLYPRLVAAEEEALKGQRTGDLQCDVVIAVSTRKRDIGVRIDLDWFRACMQ